MHRFFFSIPLQSSGTAADWEGVMAAFLHCARNATHQSVGDVTTVVCCHDIAPGAREVIEGFPGIHIIEADFDPPDATADKQLRRKDKLRKLRTIASWIRSEGGGHVMHLDADDLVSRDLVQHVRRDAPEGGVIYGRGYMMDWGTGLCRRIPDAHTPEGQTFYSGSGSSAVVFYDPDGLPVSADDDSRGRLYNRLRGHKLWPEFFLYNKLPYVMSEELDVVGVRQHGSNMTSLRDDGVVSKPKLRFERQQFMEFGGEPTPEMIDRFNLNYRPPGTARVKAA